jgi:hypothetical protein
MLLVASSVLLLIAGGAPAWGSTDPGSVEALPPVAPLPADRAAQGIQGGWAIDDAGQVAFAHGLLGQLPLIQASGAGWVRINFRLGAAFRNWTDPGAGGHTALERYDVVVDDARARGLQVLGLLSNDSWVGSQGEWTAGAAELGQGNGDNAYLHAFSQQAAVVLARHFLGRIDTWEVWNEPNAWLANPLPGVYQGDTFLYPSNFAWLLRHVYEDTRLAGVTGLTLVAGGVTGSNYGGYGVPQRGDYRTAAEGRVLAEVGSAASFPTPVPYPTFTPLPTPTPAAAILGGLGASAAPDAPDGTAPPPNGAAGATAAGRAGAAPQPGISSGARYLGATYEEGMSRAGWTDVRQATGSYPLDAIGQHLYVEQGSAVPSWLLRAFLEDLRAAYEAFEGPATPKSTIVTEFGWTSPGVTPAVQAANLQSAYAVFRSVPYVKNAYWFSAQDVPEASIFYGLQTGGEAADGYGGAAKTAFRAYQASAGGKVPAPPAATPAPATAAIAATPTAARGAATPLAPATRPTATPAAGVQAAAGTVRVLLPGRAQPVVIEAGTIPRQPDDTCPRDWAYRGYVRLQDASVGGSSAGGAVYGVAEGGALDWIPPEAVGCVEWPRVPPEVSFPKEVIAQFRLLRLRPRALLWVIDGDDFWKGRLYEVDAGGQARFVTPGAWEADFERYQVLWPNVTPVGWAYVYDLHRQGAVGPDV